MEAGLPPQQAASEPEVKAFSRDQSTLVSLKYEPKAQPQANEGVWNSVSTTVSNFFTTMIGWTWGSTPAKAIPADMKAEEGPVEGVTSKPALSKNSRLVRF